MKNKLIILIIILTWACNPRTEEKINTNIFPIQTQKDSIKKWCNSTFIADSCELQINNKVEFKKNFSKLSFFILDMYLAQKF